MSGRTISQREAKRLQRRVASLEAQIRLEHATYGRDYPGGINIATLELDAIAAGILKTAQLLRHPIVVVYENGVARIYALEALPL